MNKTFIILVITFFSVNVFSQNIKQDIQEIREQFKWTNSQKQFIKIVLENEEFEDNVPSEGCGLEGYYIDGILYKIVESVMVSTALYTNEYYLKNNKLIFVFRKEVKFEVEENFENKTTYEERVYYKNGKTIRHLEKMKSVLSKNLDYKKKFNKLKLLLDIKVKHESDYNLLQGTWRNIDDNDDWYTIKGLRKDQYYKADIQDVCRFWFEEKYFYYHCIEENTTIKYKILKLTNNRLKMQNKFEGNIEIYEKIED